jgi:hypothetical protein
MWGVVSTLAQTQAAAAYRFAPVQSMTADACGQIDDGCSNRGTKYRLTG